METVFIVIRVVVSLGAVFGALFWGHRWISKRGAGGARGKQIAIVARQALGAKAGVAIVDAHGRRYLLGVTEHTVTVLDTLGPAEGSDGTVQLVSTAPVSVPTFERELQTVTRSTGAVPGPTAAGSGAPGTGVTAVQVGMLVHGRGDAAHPNGPITRTVAITSAVAITRPAPSMPIESLAAPAYPSRRAARDAGQTRTAAPAAQVGAAPAKGPLAGSVLSPQTWKQTVSALKQLR